VKVIIVEDEPRAANRLERLILELNSDFKILAKLPSIAQTLHWLKHNKEPDLMFFDIRLEDGESFDILSQHSVTAPIVFCTAYHDYALKAFSVNSIDYLLKPIVKQDLSRALDKYSKLTGVKMNSSLWPSLIRQKKGPLGAFRQQFLIVVAGCFTPIKTNDVIAVTSYLKSSQLIDREGKAWLLDDSLVSIEQCLNPEHFIRISRQWLIRLSEIEKISPTGSGHTVKLKGLDDAIKVSRAKVTTLKNRIQSMKA